ncbi:MAG TPA: hypothetical protein PLA43_05485 [Bryobacteraceae bacterium]|nr:hypothetical protein [Bryobacteraceae bacterium]HOL71507.1 hypothetical protein [Bryobacteraceae bacterium]HOQ45301.1 hypothetical protein [Bryobacteraceae bacterium]HPQ13634.1 hypothetical protein [Bryobacteraceae bacterium]HPU71387.1 hypothetical protein [Bryobacteraceae bacterium]
MTVAVQKKVRELKKSILDNSAIVKKELSRAGRKADAAAIHSAAKYYVALKKLAQE